MRDAARGASKKREDHPVLQIILFIIAASSRIVPCPVIGKIICACSTNLEKTFACQILLITCTNYLINSLENGFSIHKPSRKNNCETSHYEWLLLFRSPTYHREKIDHVACAKPTGIVNLNAPPIGAHLQSSYAVFSLSFLRLGGLFCTGNSLLPFRGLGEDRAFNDDGDR